jgi:NitT/TauT family transport system ATP-binding protein
VTSSTGAVAAKGSSSTGAPGAIISLSEVGFRYPNGLEAIGNISLEVSRGEILAVVGPSGCGKSTLLRLLAGLAAPTRGTIARADRGEDRHPTTMVFQEDTVVPSLKVFDNVGLHYRFRSRAGWKRDSAAVEHVNKLLAMVGLEDFADFYPAKLSGGMKRRVAVLTAVAPLPSLLLMDEPFSALDEPTRILVHGDIYRLVREFGISTILVTHDLGEAISLSDRVVLLSRAPAHAVAEFATPFGRERDLLDIRRTPEFLEFYGKVWGELEQQIKAGRKQA